VLHAEPRYAVDAAGVVRMRSPRRIGDDGLKPFSTNRVSACNSDRLPMIGSAIALESSSTWLAIPTSTRFRLEMMGEP
jgi:hypothetical protein